jgi:hypothetical protein
MAIKTTPKSTADGSLKAAYKAAVKAGKGNAFLNKHPKFKAAQKKASIPNPAKNPQDLKLYDAYERAVAAGKEAMFLKQHPKFAKNFGSAIPQRSGIAKLTDNSKPGAVFNKNMQAATQQAQSETLSENLGSNTNAFGTSGVAIGPDGRPMAYSTDSASQAGIREGGEQLSQAGLNAANQNVQNYNAFNWKGSPEERARIEQEVYGRLTRNVDRDFNQEFDAMEQRMYNRGIPLDPSNPAYKREADALNEKYSAIKENASAQAAATGGEEMSRSFGIAQQGQQQFMNETGQLQGMGIGYQGAPQTGYNAADYQSTNFPELWSATRGQNQSYDVGLKGIEAQKGIAAMQLQAAEKAAAGEEEEEIPT